MISVASQIVQSAAGTRIAYGKRITELSPHWFPRCTVRYFPEAKYARAWIVRNGKSDEHRIHVPNVWRSNSGTQSATTCWDGR